MGDSRRDFAIEVYASQFGIPPSEVPGALRRLFGPRMAEEGLASMGGSAWDDTLSRRERSLIVVSALIAQGGVEDRLRPHLHWAVRNGITRDELDALVSMLTVYVGFPRAGAGMSVLIEELGNSQQSTVDN